MSDLSEALRASGSFVGAVIRTSGWALKTVAVTATATVDAIPTVGNTVGEFISGASKEAGIADLKGLPRKANRLGRDAIKLLMEE